MMCHQATENMDRKNLRCFNLLVIIKSERRNNTSNLCFLLACVWRVWVKDGITSQEANRLSSNFFLHRNVGNQLKCFWQPFSLVILIDFSVPTKHMWYWVTQKRQHRRRRWRGRCVYKHMMRIYRQKFFLAKSPSNVSSIRRIDYDSSIIITVRLATLAQIVTNQINAFMRTNPKADKKATKSIAKKVQLPFAAKTGTLNYVFCAVSSDARFRVTPVARSPFFFLFWSQLLIKHKSNKYYDAKNAVKGDTLSHDVKAVNSPPDISAQIDVLC